MEYQKISAELRFKILRSFYSREEMAFFIGVSHASWSQWESGKGKPPFHKLILIAEKTGVDLHWLITGEKATNLGEPPHLPWPIEKPNCQPPNLIEKTQKHQNK